MIHRDACTLHVDVMTGRADYLCYTDGSCKAGDDAPGGWGFVVRPPNGAPIEGFGSAARTLAKTMEYRAVAEALAVLPREARATVFSDNQALVENMTKRLADWSRASFVNVDPHVVDSVRAIDACIRDKALVVRWQWVRAHAGNAGNARADALAAQGARNAKAELAGAGGGPGERRRG
jgi:ribonuclease HI